jgi:hypothetical protein
MLAILIAALALQAAAVEQGQTYTISASALKAKVKAEADKVEKARVDAQSGTLADMMTHHDSMTQAQRLEEMAALIGKDSETSGADMIKALSEEAREHLANIQKTFTTGVSSMLEQVSHIEDKMPSKGVDPAKDQERSDALAPLEAVMAPLKALINSAEMSHPMLKPWTSKVTQFSSFFEQDSLQDMLGSPLKDLQKYKTEFHTYTDDHKTQVEDFLEMMSFNDMLTVLRSPEL